MKPNFGLPTVYDLHGINKKAAVTDYAILTGAYVSDSCALDDDYSLKGRTGWYWTKTPFESEDYAERAVNDNGINIYRQLDISFDLVNGKRILDEELKNYNNIDILFEVINILKKSEEKDLEKEICTEVYKDLNNVLTSIMSTLEITDISENCKYTNFIGESCALFNKVSSNIDRYIKEMERYKDFFSSSRIFKERK